MLLLYLHVFIFLQYTLQAQVVRMCSGLHAFCMVIPFSVLHVYMYLMLLCNYLSLYINPVCLIRVKGENSRITI